MNYPYGEMVLFTGNQSAIANTIKFISENITDISLYTIGIVNLLMLFSIVIAALFIFLIFRDLYELLHGNWALLKNLLLKYSPGTKVNITM